MRLALPLLVLAAACSSPPAPAAQTPAEQCAAMPWPLPVPDVRGAVYFYAETTLTCFTPGPALDPAGRDISSSPDLDPIRWQVVEQRPAAGSLVGEHEPVTLLLAPRP